MIKCEWNQNQGREAHSSLHCQSRKWGLKMRNLKPILLVEDDGVDIMMVKRALKDLNVANPLAHTLNGEEALEYLTAESNRRPCIILLDLNMPKMTGVEFLKAVKRSHTARFFKKYLQGK